jgi:hypothetical protein
MLWHKAADKKGLTVNEFLERHSSPELTEIIARDRIDPIDSTWRMELAIGKLCSLFFNYHRDRNSNEILSAMDFIPKWGEQYREEEVEEVLQTPEQMRDAMRKRRK